MRAEEVRTVEFQQTLRGYDMDEVDGLLGRIALELDARRSPAALVEQARFRTTLRGYHCGDVDRFLNLLLDAEPHQTPWPQPGDSRDARPHSRARSYAAPRSERETLRKESRDRKRETLQDQVVEWTSYPDLAGTHLHWQGPSRHRQLSQRDGVVLLTVDVGWLCFGRSFKTAEHTYRQKTVRKGRSTSTGRDREEPVKEVYDAERFTPIMRITGVHFNHKASSVVELAGGGRFTFPVKGRRRRFALMNGVDEAGRIVLRFRRVSIRARGVEVVVDSSHRPTEELICVIAVASTFLGSYFEKPGGA